MRTNLKPEHYREIIDIYLKGQLSIKKISELYRCNRDTVSAILKRNNITKFKRGHYIRKHTLNERYFDVIDTENKAYFLGLLYADGCNHTNGKKKISIALQEQDKEILSKFSKELYGDEFLYFRNGRNGGKNQFVLYINSAHISDKLAELGCIARKSLILKFPEWLIDPELQKHFMRGYFDGDGSLGSYKRKDKTSLDYSFAITSTADFCNKAAKIIKNKTKVNVLTRILDKKCNSITSCTYVRGRYQISRVLDWLYKDATVYLDRKYARYLNIKNLELCNK
jgi:intein/homing endonuclease